MHSWPKTLHSMVSTVILGSLRVIEDSFELHGTRLSGGSGPKDMHICKMLNGSCIEHGIWKTPIYFGI